MADPPPHTQDPTGRFTPRADAYTRCRPSYPPAALDALWRLLPGPDPIIADLGAGTGIFSNLLADRGARVLAIEPNAAMRAAAPTSPHVMWVDAAAERTTLSPASVDAVTAAQAFHWFRPADAAREALRILRPAGVLALIWNVRDDRDPPTAAYSEVMADASGCASLDRGEFDRATVESAGFGPLTLQEFPAEQLLDRDGLIGRALSASYFPDRGPYHDALVARLHEAFDAHARDGVIRLRYTTRLWTGVRPPIP